MSVQLSGAEEGDNITQGGEITFTCSVENVPGLTSVDWFRGEEHLETRDLVREEQRLVDSLTLDTSSLELGEAVILCRPDLVTAGFNNNDMAASVRINLVQEAMEYDSSEVEYYDDEEQDGEYYDEYESSEEEDSYESDEEVPEMITLNPTNSQELITTKETTSRSFFEVSETTTLSGFLEHSNEYDDEEDAVSESLQPDNLVNDQSEDQYRDYNYDGATATDYYEDASYQNYAFGNNEMDREEITLTEEKSEDFKSRDEAGDATEIKDKEDMEPDAATNSFTSREKVLAQTKQRAENGNNVATFSQKTLKSGGCKLVSYFPSQAVLLLLMFKLV